MYYCGLPPPFYPIPDAPFPPPNPIVLGEGDVTTVVCPDGSLQYFFVPTAARWPSDINPFRKCRSCCPCTCSTPNGAAWLIKSIQPGYGNQPMFNQTNPGNDVRLLSQQYNFDSTNKPFEIKFHNDGWTSTTDLHYFYPSLRCREWVPKVGAQVQVEIPTERNIFHYVALDSPKNVSNSNMDVDDEKSTSSKNCKCNTVKFEKSVATSREQGSSPSYDGQTQTLKKRTRKKSTNLCICDSDCSSGRNCGCDIDSDY